MYQSLLPKVIVGNNIKRIRQEKGFSGSSLSKLLLYSQQHISRIERGEVRLHLSQVIHIANCLEVEVKELLFGVGFQENNNYLINYISDTKPFIPPSGLFK